MSAALATDLLLCLLIYLVLALAFLGWGRVAELFLFRGKRCKYGLPTLRLWLGFAVFLWLVQLANLFFALRGGLVILFLLAGVLAAVPGILRWGRGGGHRNWLCRPLPPEALLLVLMLVAALWITSTSMLPPGKSDAALYYLNTLRWLNTYPLVPGLGNLHGRLAFNNAYFPYVGALNFTPWFNYGRVVADGSVMLLLLLTCLDGLRPLLHKPRRLVQEHAFRYLPFLLFLPLWLWMGIAKLDLGFATPDLASRLLQLLLLFTLMYLVTQLREGKKLVDAAECYLIPFLAATAITIKLSNLAFAGTLVVLLLLFLWRQGHAKTLWKPILLGILLGLTWMIRGVILSGYPLFPSTVLRMPVEWAVPAELAESEANWVYSWARQPLGDPIHVLESWEWLRYWPATYLDAELGFRLKVILVLTLGALLGMIGRHFRARLCRVEWACCLPLLAAIAFWFFTAPAPRFVLGILEGAAILSGCLLVHIWLNRAPAVQIRSSLRLALMAAVLVASSAYFVRTMYAYRRAFLYMPQNGLVPVREVPLEIRTTRSGLDVYVPSGSNTQLTYDAPLPATPYHRFQPGLRLRVPGDLSSGFLLDEIELGDSWEWRPNSVLQQSREAETP